jgi:hypothetical protein
VFPREMFLSFEAIMNSLKSVRVEVYEVK